MSKTRILLLMAGMTGFAFFQSAKANALETEEFVILADVPALKNDTAFKTDTLCLEAIAPQPAATAVDPPADQPGKKKLVCALFALPFPCGFVGAHRVMLGTKPWVPIVYVATFGGCFGLLPLIDFCFITFSKDISQFENNPHVFMWAK